MSITCIIAEKQFRNSISEMGFEILRLAFLLMDKSDMRIGTKKKKN